MTIVDIPGIITGIQYEDVPANFEFVFLSAGTDGTDPPTEIGPTGKPITVVLASNTNLGGFSTSGFIMSSSFNVGDVVEIYLVSSISGQTLTVFDENNNQIVTKSGLGVGAVCRKLSTENGITWGTVS